MKERGAVRQQQWLQSNKGRGARRRNACKYVRDARCEHEREHRMRLQHEGSQRGWW